MTSVQSSAVVVSHDPPEYFYAQFMTSIGDKVYAR